MSDIVTALGPGGKLDSLSSFAPDYATVRRALNNLLVFPHLEVIEIEDSSKSNLFSLVIDGNSLFSGLSGIDIELARKVISYDAAFSALVDTSNIQLLVKTLQPVAQECADHARAHSEVNLKFFADFTDYIASVDRRIGSMDAVLAQLDTQIQAQSEALANKNVITTLWEVLRTLYKLASTAEDSDVQVAAILGVTVNTISGSFESLFDDQLRLQKIISSLKGLRTRTQDLKTRFVALNAGLKTVSSSSKSLLDVWDDVAARMGTVTDDMDLVPAPQAQQLKNAWANVAIDAKEYIDVLQKSAASASSVESHRVIIAKFNSFPKVPITANEIRLYKLAAVYGQDALLVCAPEGSIGSSINFAASNDSDEKVVETVLGPPAETQKKLDDLADNTGRIMKEFNNLLQQPFLGQFKCTSPIDGKDSNLLNVITYYREKYLQLQLDTLPVARDLGSYAALQKALLVPLSDHAQPHGGLTLKELFDTNAPIVKEYYKKANRLSVRSTKMKNDWKLAVDTVKRLINQSDSNIKTIDKSIDKLTKQEKEASFYSFLFLIGAFVVFTFAAFTAPEGLVYSLGIGGALGGMALYEAIKESKITEAINVLETSLTNAKNTRSHLDGLLPYIKTIEESLTSVSQLWSDITNALSTLSSFYDVLKRNPALLKALKPTIIKNWVAVQEDVDKYIKVVSG